MGGSYHAVGASYLDEGASYHACWRPLTMRVGGLLPLTNWWLGARQPYFFNPMPLHRCLIHIMVAQVSYHWFELVRQPLYVYESFHFY